MAFTAKILSWRFRHLSIVGCLLKRRPTKGGSRAPQDPPPPSYAPGPVLSCISPAPSYSNYHEEPVELGWIKVPHSCRHERHFFMSVSDFRSFFTRTYMRKNCLKRDFKVNGIVSFLSNNRPRPTRICFDLICTTNTSSVRSGLAFFHTYSMKMVTGNSTLRAYSPWRKFTKVSGGSAFLCMKS